MGGVVLRRLLLFLVLLSGIISFVHWAETDMKPILSPSVLLVSLWTSFTFPYDALGLITSSALTRHDPNNGIHLAVSPICGPPSGNTSDVNAGIDLSCIKTIVAFGVRVPSALTQSFKDKEMCIIGVTVRIRTRTAGATMAARSLHPS